METVTTETVEAPKKQTMFDIQKAIKDLMDVRESMSGEEGEDIYGDQLESAREEVKTCILELAKQESDKVDSTVFVMLEMDARVAFLKAYEHRMANKRRAVENELSRLKDNLEFVMILNNLERIKGQRHMISFRKSSAVIVDVKPEELDEQFQKIVTTVTAKKADIKKAIKAGDTISGVHIEERQSVQYK